MKSIKNANKKTIFKKNHAYWCFVGNYGGYASKARVLFVGGVVLIFKVKVF